MKKRESRELWVKPLIEQANSHDSVVLLKVVSGEWSGAQRLTASDRSSLLYIVGTSTKRRLADENRPCVVISPDEMNRHIGTVIVVPLTIKGRSYPTRIPGRFQRKSGQDLAACTAVNSAAVSFLLSAHFLAAYTAVNDEFEKNTALTNFLAACTAVNNPPRGNRLPRVFLAACTAVNPSSRIARSPPTFLAACAAVNEKLTLLTLMKQFLSCLCGK